VGSLGKKSLISSHLLRLCVRSEHSVAAETLKEAMDGVGCDALMCAQILVARHNSEINAIKNEFKTMFGKDLEQRLVKETGGDVEKFFGI
jgi:hypothetical protein